MKGREPTHWWIKTTVYHCPPCGSEDVVRERMVLPKPKNQNERYVWVQQYDWCVER